MSSSARCQSAEVLYPEWVQRLIEDCDDDDKNIKDIDAGLDQQPKPSRPAEFRAAAPEFSPALSTIYSTLQPIGIWVGLNHLARKIGYAARGWEMIWDLADIGWIQLSDCGLYCRLADSWGSYEATVDPALSSSSSTTTSSVSLECGDMQQQQQHYGIYRSGLEAQEGWRKVCEREEDGAVAVGGLEPLELQTWTWNSPSTRGCLVDNPSVMLTGLLE